jgi:hypothetical protein
MFSLGRWRALRHCKSKDRPSTLVDIDLADGPSGPSAVAWLSARGIPAIFVTGQEAVAAQYADIVVGIVGKPISERALKAALQLLGKGHT